jgi:hypothetical protein
MSEKEMITEKEWNEKIETLKTRWGSRKRPKFLCNHIYISAEDEYPSTISNTVKYQHGNIKRWFNLGGRWIDYETKKCIKCGGYKLELCNDGYE